MKPHIRRVLVGISVVGILWAGTVTIGRSQLEHRLQRELPSQWATTISARWPLFISVHLDRGPNAPFVDGQWQDRIYLWYGVGVVVFGETIRIS
jgi:hypothetical protein